MKNNKFIKANYNVNIFAAIGWRESLENIEEIENVENVENFEELLYNF